MRHINLILVLIFAIGVLSAVVFLICGLAHQSYLSPELLFAGAMALGGIGGGFSAALSGGKQYALRMPGPKKNDGTKDFEAGFVGDLFIGLMTGFLGIGLADTFFRPEIFPSSDKSLLFQLIHYFAIAFISGFLGLRLIRMVTSQMHPDLKEFEERIEKNEVAQLYDEAERAIESGDEQTALENFERVIECDGRLRLRGYIGKARVLKRLGKLQEAIETLNFALGKSYSHERKANRAIALFNRACYRALALNSSTSAHSIEDIARDLEGAIKLRPEFAGDIKTDDDLKSVRDEDIISTLIP